MQSETALVPSDPAHRSAPTVRWPEGFSSQRTHAREGRQHTNIWFKQRRSHATGNALHRHLSV